jgi:hypothetical protein
VKGGILPLLLLFIWRYLLPMLETTVSRGTILLVVALLLVALLLLVVVALALLLGRVALLLVATLFIALLLGRVLALRRVLLVALIVLIVRTRHDDCVRFVGGKGN